MAEKTRTPRSAGRVAFLAQQKIIEEMLGQGWSASKVYEKLKPKLGTLSQRQFLEHVKKIIVENKLPATVAAVRRSTVEQAEKFSAVAGRGAEPPAPPALPVPSPAQEQPAPAAQPPKADAAPPAPPPVPRGTKPASQPRFKDSFDRTPNLDDLINGKGIDE
ncbi:MAG: TraK family protein [Magnetospirillum sp.]|nr:TraK family protein [Magnetospirillum sp.]